MSKTNDIAWGLTLGAGWLWTWKQLSLTWSSYPNYEFGYLVPWIVVLLALRRLQISPGSLNQIQPPQPVRRFFAGSALAVAWVLFLFAELVRQFDPHWRIVSWLMMVSVTLLTAMWLWRRGGRKLLATLAFPLGFAWTAAPWPTRPEEIVTLKLRAFVTHATVFALHAMGITASQHGNSIDLTNGTVIVDSACSGISSLQVTIMTSLFLGEFFLFSGVTRCVLAAAGSLVAVAFNLARAIILVRLANDFGAETLLKYHDRLGYGETAGIFLALVLIAWLMSLRSSRSRDQSAGQAPPAAAELRNGPAAAIPGYEGWALSLAFALLPLITWAWFALSPGGPIRRQDMPLWLLRDHPVAADWRVQPVTLSPIDIRSLNFTDGQTICLAGPLDKSALVYHFFWKTDANAFFGHTPDICMTATGWEREADPVNISMRVNDAEFPAKLYRFKRDGEEMVVLQGVWYGGDPLLSSSEFPYAKGAGRTSRLALLWNEPRRRGLESLSVYMPPAGNQAAQTRAAEEILAHVLVPNPDFEVGGSRIFVSR